MLCGLALCAAGTLGCGNGVANPQTPILTPTGTSTVTVTGVSGTLTHSNTVTLTVIPARS